MREVVMVSGGLDSFLASALLPGAKKVFVEWGQPYLEMERVAVRELHPGAVTVSVQGLPPLPDGDPYAPARNLMFTTIGARFGDRVCLAGVRDEMCADKSPDAFRAMSAILSSHCKGAVEVFSPLWGRTKDEAVSDYLRGGGDPAVLLKTISCYGDGLSPCLDCEACFRRFVALRSNGVPVPRPSDAIVRSYGLGRLSSTPPATCHAILRALHETGTPVVAHPVEDVEGAVDPGFPHVRIFFTPSRMVGPDLMARTLTECGVRFDAVMAGVEQHFFDFNAGVLP